MMGAGSLGGALISDNGLQRYGLNVVAGIDLNPTLIGTAINGVRIFSPSDTERLVRELDVKIGIIAVPVDSAQDVADTLAGAGVQAIWNFTPSRIRVREGMVIANTSIYSHLAVMYNRLQSLNKENKK